VGFQFGKVDNGIRFKDRTGDKGRFQNGPVEGDLSKSALSQIHKRHSKFLTDIPETGGRELISLAEVDVIADRGEDAEVKKKTQDLANQKRMGADGPVRDSMRGKMVDFDKNIHPRRQERARAAEKLQALLDGPPQGPGFIDGAADDSYLSTPPAIFSGARGGS
jgi:hypothetical protein